MQTFHVHDGAEIHDVDVGSAQPMIYVCGIGSTSESQILNATLMHLYDCTHMAASKNQKQWRSCTAVFAYP